MFLGLSIWLFDRGTSEMGKNESEGRTPAIDTAANSEHGVNRGCKIRKEAVEDRETAVLALI